MDFSELIKSLLGITDDFSVDKIVTNETSKEIEIHLNYISNRYNFDNKEFPIYDFAPERRWQHLNWFEYRTFLICSLPRYVNSEGKVKTIDISFAPKSRSYTHKFSQHVISFLQEIRVQSTTAKLLNTTAYIVRSIMEDAVENALEKRGFINDFKNISLDEKAYKEGHEYATILIDSDKDCVINLAQGRKEKSVKALFFEVNEQEKQPQIERINIDMWKPYMNVMKELAPKALQVHDKFHLFKKLSDAIDKTRKSELSENPILINQKYTFLKNQENRTEAQQRSFEIINKTNLKTAEAWVVRENFKSVFQPNHWNDMIKLYDNWLDNSTQANIKYVTDVINTFKRHRNGIVNAILTQTNSGKHENLNGKIQSVLAKARGFLNFQRFKINVMFYFGNLQLIPLKFY
jgi:transposase